MAVLALKLQGRSYISGTTIKKESQVIHRNYIYQTPMSYSVSITTD
ncbi:hypothetical protein DSUL_60264 [Desulfovibrionales bacterium]